ncbi:hypothetical protein GX408_16360 [bacterium]|nr:hypothetical protein [bacterium]
MGRSMHGKRETLRTTFWAIASSNQRELLSAFPAALAGYLLCQGNCVSWLRPDFFDLLHQPEKKPLRRPDSDKIARMFIHAPELCRSAIANAAALLNGCTEAKARLEKLFILNLATCLSQTAVDLFLAADKRLYLIELDQDSLEHAQCFFDNLMQRLGERGFVQDRGPSAQPPAGRPICEIGAGSFEKTGQQSKPLQIKTLGLYSTSDSINTADFETWHHQLQTSLPGLDLLGRWKTDADFAAWFSVLESFYNQIDQQDGLRLVAHMAKRLNMVGDINANENDVKTVYNGTFPYQVIHQQLVLDLDPK